MSFNLKRKTPVYPPEFNDEFKAKIKRRDKHRCGLCDRRMQKLDIHHIDYTKHTVSSNCIALCRPCHSVLHASDWTYKNKMLYYLQRLVAQRERALA